MKHIVITKKPLDLAMHEAGPIEQPFEPDMKPLRKEALKQARA